MNIGFGCRLKMFPIIVARFQPVLVIMLDAEERTTRDIDEGLALLSTSVLHHLNALCMTALRTWTTNTWTEHLRTEAQTHPCRGNASTSRCECLSSPLSV